MELLEKASGKEISMEGAPVKVESCVEINQGSHGDDVAPMAWKLHAIEQTQLRRKCRVDGVGRPKFDFHTGSSRRWHCK